MKNNYYDIGDMVYFMYNTDIPRKLAFIDDICEDGTGVWVCFFEDIDYVDTQRFYCSYKNNLLRLYMKGGSF